jgi:hypothetical protein
MANMLELTTILDEVFCSRPMAYWYEVFSKAHVTFGDERVSRQGQYLVRAHRHT